MLIDVASDFIEPPVEDTLEYVKQPQIKLNMCSCKKLWGVMQ
jgi:hypothetical protein